MDDVTIIDDPTPILAAERHPAGGTCSECGGPLPEREFTVCYIHPAPTRPICDGCAMPELVAEAMRMVDEAREAERPGGQVRMSDLLRRTGEPERRSR